MAVTEEEQSQEEKIESQQDRTEKANEISKGLADSLGFGTEEESKEEKAVEEPSEEEEQEDAEELTDESSADTTSDEDLIPKSKFHKRVNELTAEKAALKARVRQLESDIVKPDEPVDSEQTKLEAMSKTELKALKRQVRVAQLKSSDDEGKVAELLDLEEKIDETIANAPKMFVKKQVSAFDNAVTRTASEIEDFETVKPSIFKYAQGIYSNSAALASSVNGQADAWDMAVQHYNALKSVSSKPAKVNELKRELNSLKKKTSLDANSIKGNVSKDRSKKLYAKAKDGTLDDKQEFIKQTFVSKMFPGEA